MGFKENIKHRRLELNMTLDEVSKQLEVSKPTLQRYESGVISNVPFDKIERLSDILKTTPSYLMDWNDDCVTKDEKILLDKYKSLDEMGKHIINVILDMELNRINNNISI